MMTALSPCRTYIVYHHGLFAQGVRSVLETRRAVQIVGMESDVGKALKAVQTLKPEVIIVEESTGKHQRMRLGAFLNGSTGGRVVTLSLDHEFATVYDRHRMDANDPADLVRAIRGVGKQRVPGPDRPDPKASMLFKPVSKANGNKGRSAPASRLRQIAKEEATQTETVSRTARARKGG
jgi:DNA-binding NarL/FixJ family response regulator